MTEDDARKRWCPMVRYKSTKGEGINRWVDIDDAQMLPDMARCIASECMMWQWIQETKIFAANESPVDEGWRKIGAAPMSEAYSIIWLKEPDEKTQGYCGLAGKP